MRHYIRLCLAIAAAFAVATAARAETVTKTLDGTALELRLDCFKTTTIDPEPGLQGKIEIVATANYQDELDPLTFAGGPAARIERPGRCTPHRSSTEVNIEGLAHFTVNSGQYTLKLAIKVPPGTPIDLRNDGSGDYAIGPVGAALKAELSGSGDIDAEDATDLDVRIGGSGDVKLHRLHGAGKIEISGSGGVEIDDGTAPSLRVSLHGSGDVHVGSGSIDRLDADATGSGDIEIEGTVKDATVSTSGSGDVEIARATGEVHRQQSGSGDIHIGD